MYSIIRHFKIGEISEYPKTLHRKSKYTYLHFLLEIKGKLGFLIPELPDAKTKILFFLSLKLKRPIQIGNSQLNLFGKSLNSLIVGTLCTKLY